MSRSSLSIAIYMVAMFISGAVVGGFGYRLYSASSVSATGGRRSPEEFRRAYVSEMSTRLRLSDTQLKQLNTILDDTRTKMHEFREKHRPEMEQIHATQVTQIRALLDDTQRAEYERIRAERERRMKNERRPN